MDFPTYLAHVFRLVQNEWTVAWLAARAERLEKYAALCYERGVRVEACAMQAKRGMMP